MLKLEDIHSGYGRVKVLFGVSLEARPGEIFCLLGRNGAGKTTLMKTIMGLLPLTQGGITLDDRDIGSLPAHEVPKHRVGYVPQGRRLFPDLTVAENIEIGLMPCNSGAETRERVLQMFPRLRERLSQRASTLSGGEQQMLAIARALCLNPRALLLDEPTEGLQPSMIALIRDVILQMKAEGLIVILVEQRVDAVLSVADQVAFIENGRMVEALSAELVRNDPAKLHHHLGV